MSGFLQRLVARSRPLSIQSAKHEHSVQPRLGSRFEPAFGMQVQAPTFDASFHEEETVSAESVPVTPSMPDLRPPREQPQPARTIMPSAVTSHTEPPTPTMIEPVQSGQGAGTRDAASRDASALPEIASPRPQPAQPDATSDEEDVSHTERGHRSIRDIQPAKSVHPRAPVPPLEGDQPGGESISADDEVIRTIRVVHDTPISVRMDEAPVESPPVQPAPDERQQPVGQPVTLESHTPPSPEESPRQPVPTRTEQAAEPIRPQIATEAPTLPKSTAFQSRRQSADPPTIRVTIGRIEVRAAQVQQPVPTQTRHQPVRRTPGLSLDDYLAKRNEGGR